MTGAASTLVVQTAFLGDVVLTTPLLTALAEQHGPVDVVVTPAAAQLLDGHPAVSQIIRYDKHGARKGLASIFGFARQLASGNYRRAYLPHRSWRSGIVVRMAGIPERIGFADAPARSLYTDRIVRNSHHHEVERLVSLAGEVAVPPVSLALNEIDRAEAAHWLTDAGVPDRFIAVAPGAIWGTKRWNKFGSLAAASGEYVVIVGGPADQSLASEIMAMHPGRSASAVGRLSLRGSAALIERSLALVTNDSLPLHLAQATGTPVVALFGPTVPAFGFGPRGPSDRIAQVEGLACRPCSPHGPMTCPLGHHRCMVDLSSQAVQHDLESILIRTPRPS